MRTYKYLGDLFSISSEEVIAGIAEAHAQPSLVDIEYEITDSGIMYKFPDFEIVSTLDANIKHTIQGFFLRLCLSEDNEFYIQCKRHILLDTEFEAQYIHSHASGRDDVDRWRSFCWGSQNKPMDMLKTMARSELVNFTESYTSFMSYLRHYLKIESTETGPYRLITAIKPPYEDNEVRLYSEVLKFFFGYIENIRIGTNVEVASSHSYFDNPVSIEIDIDLNFEQALQDYNDQKLAFLPMEPLDSAGNVMTRIVPDWEVSKRKLQEFGGGVYFKGEYHPFILLPTERILQEPYSWGVSNKTKNEIKKRITQYLIDTLYDRYINSIKNGNQ